MAPSPASVPHPGPHSYRHDERARSEVGRGREADRPTQLPGKGWKDVLLRTKEGVKQDHLSIIAAAMAFFAMLAIFPALISLVSIYGLIFDPAQVQSHLDGIASILPSEVSSLLRDYLGTTAQVQGGALGVAAIIGILGALWSASSGTASAMKAINIVYDEEETRGFVRVRAIALALTLGIIAGVVVALALLAVLPAVLGAVGLSDSASRWIWWGRWPVLVVLGLAMLAALYRFAPNRKQATWRWITPGSVLALSLWALASVGFSLYASNFGAFGKTYGPIAAVIVLLIWLYLSSFAMLLGAEVNAELEAQTKRDTTTGPDEPMGSRGAKKADELGEARAE